MHASSLGFIFYFLAPYTVSPTDLVVVVVVVVVGVHTPGEPRVCIYVQRVRCPGAHWVGSADLHLRFLLVDEGGDGLPRLDALRC